MKNMMNICIVLLLFTGSLFAQTDNTALISKKWVINKEAMRPVIADLLSTDPETAGLKGAAKESAISEGLERISKMRIEMQADGSAVMASARGEDKGTWRFANNETVLYTKRDGGKENKFTIKSLTENELVIVSVNKVKLILKKA
ncbi:hypothetical protein ACJD0Z_00500 [Flavobacteriaceae bacterium M23B6Z8]